MYNKCLNLLNTKEKKLGFCLKMHDWIDECPILCPFFIEGDRTKVDKLMGKSYNVECIHFANKETKGKITFFCSLLKFESPYCAMCQFAKYNDFGELESLVGSGER